MNAKNEEKGLLQQITYLSRIIEQKKNALSRMPVKRNDKNVYESLLQPYHNLKNKNRCLILNSAEHQSKPSTSLPQNCNKLNHCKLSYAKLRVLNKKINASEKSVSNKSTGVNIIKEKSNPADRTGDTALKFAVKKSIHVNREKLFENIKSDTHRLLNKSCVHLNPAKFQLKCDKNYTKLNDSVNDKLSSKKVVHINPNFHKTSAIKANIGPNNIKINILPDSSQSIVLKDKCENVKNCKEAMMKIHFNKKFIEKNSTENVLRKDSKSFVAPKSSVQATKMPSCMKNVNLGENNHQINSLPNKSNVDKTVVSDNSVKVESKVSIKRVSPIIRSPDLLTNRTCVGSVGKSIFSYSPSSEKFVKLSKPKKTVPKDKDQKNRNPICRQVQNSLIKNSSLRKNGSLLVCQYKNKNKIINISKSANSVHRKINNKQEINKHFCSNKLSNSSSSNSKNLKLVNKNRQTQQKLPPVLKRSNSNSKLLKLIKLSKTKLVRAKTDTLSATNKNNPKRLVVEGKVNQNLLSNKRRKNVWIAPDKNVLSNLKNVRTKIATVSCNKLSGRYKYNSKNSSSDKQRFVKVNVPSISCARKIVSSTKNENNEISLKLPKGRYSVQKQKPSRRLSQTSNLVSVSRTKLIRKSNKDAKVNDGFKTKNAFKINNLTTNRMPTLSNKIFKAPVQTKLTPTLRMARSVMTKYKFIRNSNLNRAKIDWNSLSRRNRKVNFNINSKMKVNERLSRNTARHRRKSVTIGGIKYHTTKTKLRRKFLAKEGKIYRNKIFKNKGESYRVSRGGRSLKRLDSSYIRRRQINSLSKSNSRYRYSSFQRADSAHSRVVQAKQKSIALLTRKLRKSNEPCLIFNRLGRCSGHDRGVCNRLHDKKRVAICKKFLQGACEKKNCLLSHDVGPSKMPTCRHYLAGVCTRDDCPYLHVKVNSSAPICVPFLQGYCPDAEKVRIIYAVFYLPLVLAS